LTNVIVVIGAGQIGQAIARRVSAGKHVLLADLRPESSDAAAKVLSDAGFEVSTAIVDVSSRQSVHTLVEQPRRSETSPASSTLQVSRLRRHRLQ
jgi:saccharopine dehydrogenase-like NADP-dependent oxidoreductase